MREHRCYALGIPGGSMEDSGGQGRPVVPGAISALLQDLVRAPGEPIGGDTEFLPGTIVGKFEILRELGRGGFGVVYEAHDRELHRNVAFKALRGGARPDVREQRLLREAEAAAQLAHPNIVTVYDLGRSKDGPYLVLELLRGETLAARLGRGALTLRESLRVATEVAKAVAHAHGEGVVHRDLTPGNVFLCDGGRVKVLDFGMAHAFGRRKVDGGTSGYMAPEQRRGAPEDERTDVFSMGVILFRMLAGKLPPVASGSTGLPPLDLPGMPGLHALVTGMLAEDPVDRLRDAGEVLEALESLHRDPADLSIGDARAHVRGPPGRGGVIGLPRPLAQRRVYVGAIAVVVALAGMALGAGVLWRARPEQPAAADVVPSIVVLPFANLSPQGDQEYFADGIADEILTALSNVEGLRVIGRTTAFSFKGSAEDIRAIGRKLGVTSVLEGSVRREGTRARITARIVNVADGFSVWSQTYDRELSGTFAVQEDIARSVVAAMKVTLARGADSTPTRRHPTRPEVYDQYLIGRQFLRQNAPESYRRAAAAYEKAIGGDPTYAPAWAGLAFALIWSEPENDAEQRELEHRAMMAADKAMQLDPTLADALTARGHLRSLLQWDWAGAQADFDRALALHPGNADVLRRYAQFVLRPLGRVAEAMTFVRKALQLDPLSTHAWQYLARLHLAMGALDEAQAAAERALEISPTNAYASDTRAQALLLRGRAEEALNAAREIPLKGGRLARVAMAHHALGQEQESRQALQELEAKFSSQWAFEIAEVHAWRGDREGAFTWLELACARRDPELFMLQTSAFLRPLRDDPRYSALRRNMGLPLD